ncbi:hypothetical protein Tco_0169087 [Tanacetum coccineum]
MQVFKVTNQSVENADLKAQIQEKVFANAALKNELRKLKGNSVDTKFAKASILGKPPLQPSRNHSVVRQLNAFKSERPGISKPRESAPVKPHHVNAPSSSRNSKKESYGSNDMAHNYFLEEARKKTQDRNRNLKPREMPSARTHRKNIKNHTPNAPGPQLLTPGIISSGVVPQPPSPTPNVPPTKNVWDTLFCPMFDEYFNPSPSVVQSVLVAAVQEPVVSTGTPSSTRIDQDTPFTSTSQTTQESQSHVIPTSVEEDDHGIEVAHMDNDL